MGPTSRFVFVSFVLLAQPALAVWGVRYEVDTGSGWSSAATVDVSTGVRFVMFRVTMYHDGNEKLYRGNDFVGTSRAPLRLVMSHKITNMNDVSYGDQLLTFTRAGNFGGGPAALASNFDGSNLILGTPDAKQSFSSNLLYGNLDPRPVQLELTYYTGVVQIGNSTAGARSRQIVLTANLYGDSEHSTGLYGASFFYNETGFPLSAIASTPAVTLDATILVIPSLPSLALAFPLFLRAGRRRR